MKCIVALFIAFFVITETVAQEDQAPVDANGKRHGTWKKYHPKTYSDHSNVKKQLRYEGTFEHGKEIGVFKFYCEKCGEQPSVIKKFDADGTAQVTFYTIKGAVVSTGKMKGKQRIGEWIYYHKNSKAIMTRETYKNGKVEGIKTVYYPNGKIAETSMMKEDKMNGENKFYTDSGVLLKHFNYVDNKLHGPVKYYDATGTIKTEGQYKNDRKDGIWKYYNKGKLEKEEKFPKPQKKR